ncbi:hypothetical protein DSO57_1030563 [Entomophthora muscae]|uniref:Uncharacterized protein n=1 Tax=Entomophthora muscae TaxID=34485 RepID=A0ACC2TC24_9FUNG|nr:hypothetical protein DSO57_1030563 [Entomophthora muscae]
MAELMLVLNYLAFATVAVAQYGFHYGRGGHFPKGNPSPPQLPSLTKTAMCVRRLRTFTCRRKISLKIGKVPTSIFKKHKPQYQPKPNEIPDSSKKPTSTPNPNPYPNNPFLPKNPNEIPDSSKKPTPTPNPYPNNPFLPKKPIYNDQPNTKQPTPKKPIYDQGKEDTDDNSCHKGNFTTKANFQILMNSQADRNVIPAGQCTEWVDGRYYELTGQHITFSGMASDWAKQAYMQGNIWDVSSVPKVPSIVVMSKGAQGASLSTGHVAIVESASESSICTSNWNSPHLGKTTYKVIQPGNGIYFLTLKPGAKIENSLKPHISVY